jgi:lysophospholipase L1-like esterase
VFRIVVAGDSVTMGSGVLEEEAYPARLETELNATKGPMRFEVLNLGLAGLNFPTIVSRLEAIGLRFHPDLIVYGWTLNDIEGDAYLKTVPGGNPEGYRKRYERFDDSTSRLLRALWPRLVRLQDTFAPPVGSYPYDVTMNYFDNPPAWETMIAGFRRLAQIGKEQGVCVHVLLHTHLFALRFHHPFRRIYDRVAAAAIEQGLTVAESLPLVQGMNELDLTVAAEDPHPNTEGHRLFARALLEGLERIPSHCWSEHAPPVSATN